VGVKTDEEDEESDMKMDGFDDEDDINQFAKPRTPAKKGSTKKKSTTTAKSTTKKGKGKGKGKKTDEDDEDVDTKSKKRVRSDSIDTYLKQPAQKKVKKTSIVHDDEDSKDGIVSSVIKPALTLMPTSTPTKNFFANISHQCFSIHEKRRCSNYR